MLIQYHILIIQLAAPICYRGSLAHAKAIAYLELSLTLFINVPPWGKPPDSTEAPPDGGGADLVKGVRGQALEGAGEHISHCNY